MAILDLKHFSFLILFSSIIFIYVRRSAKAPSLDCSLLPHDHFWIRSYHIVIPEGTISGVVEVKGGKIVSVVKDDVWNGITRTTPLVDYGTKVVMPGFVDVHTHLDDPGRTEWEGFDYGTKAAAAGGITTVVDMPLNSFPSTVTKEAFDLKISAAENRIYVDVGFWGGLVPENALNVDSLKDLLDAGVLGLKAFMCPSGINDFPMTNITHVKVGMSVLAKYKRPLLVHAEVQPHTLLENKSSDERSYSTYLASRPPTWEETAVRDILTVTKDTRHGGELKGAHLHIVHLADGSTSLDLIKQGKYNGDSLSVETCPHYLAFSAEEIPDGDTRLKCAPPIRNAENREKLWQALLGNHIDFLSSDHSPTHPKLKLLDDGDFLRAWGGISSLQFVLPATWTYGYPYGITLGQLADWWSHRPAKLAGLESKGGIQQGKDADLVVWDPDGELDPSELYHKHPGISAYLGGRRLKGKVLATFVRGKLVYSEGKHSHFPCGLSILATNNPNV